MPCAASLLSFPPMDRGLGTELCPMQSNGSERTAFKCFPLQGVLLSDVCRTFLLLCRGHRALPWVYNPLWWDPHVGMVITSYSYGSPCHLSKFLTLSEPKYRTEFELIMPCISFQVLMPVKKGGGEAAFCFSSNSLIALPSFAQGLIQSRILDEEMCSLSGAQENTENNIPASPNLSNYANDPDMEHVAGREKEKLEMMSCSGCSQLVINSAKQTL